MSPREAYVYDYGKQKMKCSNKFLSVSYRGVTLTEKLDR